MTVESPTRSDRSGGGRLLTGSRLAPTRAVLAAGTLLGVALSSTVLRIPLRVQCALYLLLMVGIGLPHGGYEHVANLRRRGRTLQARYLAAYLAMVAAAGAVFFLAPVLGLFVAVGIVMLKGGVGGLHALDVLVGTGHLRTRPQRALAAAVRGGAVMVVGLLAHPGTFSAVAAAMVGAFDPGAVGRLAPAFSSTGRTLLAGAFGAAVGAHLTAGYFRRDGMGSWRVDAVETLLLVAYFAAVPPILAVGLYFPAWYAARQVLRLRAVGGEDPLAGSDPCGAARGFARDAALPFAGSLALLGALYALAPNPLGGPVATPPLGAVALYSVFVSMVAVPHVVVGSLLDREEGIWYVP